MNEDNTPKLEIVDPKEFDDKQIRRRPIIGEEEDDDDDILESRPSLRGKPLWHKRVKKCQRFLSDCSMGQHYHVFFHKRRYSYGSPVCGLLSLIIYSLLLYYLVIKFASVFMKS